MPNNEQALYKCRQQELYTIGQMAYNNCSDNLAAFSAFSPRYTVDYCANCLAEIEAAKLLPSDNARSGLSEDNRILLTRAADNASFKWQSLKHYIQEAYDDKRSAVMLKIAGQSFYTEASHYNWQKVGSIMSEGSAFIKTHLADLVANDNMPPAFGDDFDAAKNDFEVLQTKFFGGVSDTTTNAQVKIRANNAIYAKLTKMLGDGQLIFAKDDSIKQKFVFVNLKSIVSGINAAGVRGYITSADTGLPIANATVVSANDTYTAITDVEGRFDIKGMAADDYVLSFSADGYVSQTLNVTVKTGTMSSLMMELATTPPTV